MVRDLSSVDRMLAASPADLVSALVTYSPDEEARGWALKVAVLHLGLRWLEAATAAIGRRDHAELAALGGELVPILRRQARRNVETARQVRAQVSGAIRLTACRMYRARGAGRPGARATRSSARSGDSPDDGPGEPTPAPFAQRRTPA